MVRQYIWTSAHIITTVTIVTNTTVHMIIQIMVTSYGHDGINSKSPQRIQTENQNVVIPKSTVTHKVNVSCHHAIF